ncbi:MA3 domain-containing protein [Cryptosporidium serpentis]
MDLSLVSPLKVLDKRDPVYNSESEEDVDYSIVDIEKTERMVETFSWSPQGRGIEHGNTMPLEEFRGRIKNLCQDYFLGYQTQDFINGLKNLACPSFHNVVVVIAIRMALDYTPVIQQQVSALLTILRDSHLVTLQQIEDGLEKLIQSIDDICLDAPFAPERLECLVDCAILDGIIPSNFRCRYPETFLLKLIELRQSSIENNLEPFEGTKGPNKHLQALRTFKSYIKNYEEDLFSCKFEGDEVEKLLKDAYTSAYQESHWNGEDWASTSFKSTCDSDDTDCKVLKTSMSSDTSTRKACIPETLCFNHEFVKFIVISSMNHTHRYRELVSIGLSILTPGILKSSDIVVGFMRLLGNLDDLSLDVIDACELTAKFICRCIVDELLPPFFIDVNLILHMGGPGGIQALNIARHFFEDKPRNILTYQARNIWSQIDDTEETKHFKSRLQEILSEYFLDLDKRGCVKLLHSLNLTNKRKAEVVRKIATLSIERKVSTKQLDYSDLKTSSFGTNSDKPDNFNIQLGLERESRAGLALLEYLLSQGFADENIIVEGFDEMVEKLPEVSIDIPQANELLLWFTSKAKDRAILPPYWGIQI